MAESRRKRATLEVGAEVIESTLGRLRATLGEGAVKLSTFKSAVLPESLGLQAVSSGGAAWRAEAAPVVLGGERCAALRDGVTPRAKRLGQVSKKKNVGLLVSDIEHLLSAAQRMPQAAIPALDPAGALGELLAAVDAARDERTGLSFVPAVVRRLIGGMELSAAHAALLTAARRELLELRPEGGLGRLSEEELALCPPGPAGTRLSWARRASGAAA